jgi:uncharacterized membrane protein YhiD involved in acid resistance
MNKLESFQQFLATQSIQIPILEFVLNMLISFLLAFILNLLYVKYGHSLSNRKVFSRNFILLSLTTMVIISIVKSSLALSLGLVGALSIVRFRAAIKEPEELTYLFLAIAIGLGGGANQIAITVIAFIFIACVIILMNSNRKKDDSQNFYINISTDTSFGITKISEILKKHCSSVSLRRFDDSADLFEASFQIDIDSTDSLENIVSEIKIQNKDSKITFLDN